MNCKPILEYLSALERNNEREWYHSHKPELARANGEFEELIRFLIIELRESDGSIPLLEPKDLTFKLARDTRFSHDKSPYNPSFRAHISARGKLPIPVGYYLMLKPGGSFLGGGLFADMFKDATGMVREYLASHGGEWQELLEEPAFAKLFTVGGTKLKRVPQGYDPEHPQAEFLKHKSWYLEYPVSDEQVLAPGFPKFAVTVFQKMQPFNAYLNRALEGFQMPER